MSFTCYLNLGNSTLESVGPPAHIGLTVGYFIVDTASNTAVPTADGDFTGSVTAALTTPVASQASVLTSIQAAVSAKETGHSPLTFIWVGL
jgi:hypothetical protein